MRVKKEVEEDYESLRNNIASAPGNDDEISILGDLVDSLWVILTPAQQAELMGDLGDMIAMAEEWAEAASEL